MNIKKAIALSLVTLFLLSGCSHKEHNLMIAQANKERFVAFAAGMANVESEAGRLGLAMAFASNMGVQNFTKPESVKDYMLAFAPYLSVISNIFGGQIGDRTSSPSIKAGGDVYIRSSKNDSLSFTNSTYTRLRNAVSNGSGSIGSPTLSTSEVAASE